LEVGEPSAAFDFSTLYAAGGLATTDAASAVFDRVPGDLSRTPADGAMATAAVHAGYPAVPGVYLNLPVAMLLFRPLTWVDFATACWTNIALNLVALLGLAFSVAHLTSTLIRGTGELTAHTPIARFEPTSRFWRGTSRELSGCVIGVASLTLLACISHPVRYNVQLGNLSVLLTMGVLSAYILDRLRFGVLGGLILGVSILVKPAPAFLLIYFIMRRRWATVIATTTTLLVIMGVGIAYYGPEMHHRWLDIVRWNREHTFVAWNNQSLLAGLLRFDARPEEIATWNVRAAPPWAIWTESALFFAAASWWGWTVFRRRFAVRDDETFAAGMVLMTIALPFAWTHYFIVLLWPTAIIAARLLTHGTQANVVDWIGLAIVVAAWVANPRWTFELTHGWEAIPLVGRAAPRLLVSHVLASAIVLFIALLGSPAPGLRKQGA
jgi:hypothetical protein